MKRNRHTLVGRLYIGCRRAEGQGSGRRGTLRSRAKGAVIVLAAVIGQAQNRLQARVAQAQEAAASR